MTIAQAKRAFRMAVADAGGQKAAAKLLGVSPSMVNHVIHGNRQVGLKVAVGAERAFGIPHSAWLPR